MLRHVNVCGGLIENGPHQACVWTRGPQLVEVIRRDHGSLEDMLSLRLGFEGPVLVCSQLSAAAPANTLAACFYAALP